jgi:hypothetical protein
MFVEIWKKMSLPHTIIIGQAKFSLQEYILEANSLLKFSNTYKNTGKRTMKYFKIVFL